MYWGEPEMSRPEPIRQAAGESLGEIAKELLSDISDLIRSEFQLARVELTNAAVMGLRGAIWIGVGFAVVYLALVFLLLAVISALTTLMSYADAALLVGVVVLILGVIAAWIGFRKIMGVRDTATLPATRKTLQEDVTWLQNRRR
jgi:uncharacterized membrane protein YqjE